MARADRRAESGRVLDRRRLVFKRLRREVSVAFDNRREYYRVPFPASSRPRLVVGMTISEVLECSERGLTYRSPTPDEVEVGTPFQGRIRFLRGLDLPVRGEVVRVEGNRVSAELQAPGIPATVMLEEQQALRRR